MEEQRQLVTGDAHGIVCSKEENVGFGDVSDC